MYTRGPLEWIHGGLQRATPHTPPRTTWPGDRDREGQRKKREREEKMNCFFLLIFLAFLFFWHFVNFDFFGIFSFSKV